MKKVVFLYLLLISTSFLAYSQEYLSQSLNAPSLGLFHKVEDIDHDGDDDYFVIADTFVMWFDSPQDLSDTNFIGSTLPWYKWHTKIVDLNNDGQSEIMIYKSGLTMIFQNNGSGVFDTASVNSIPIYEYDIFHDFDGDGYQDIVQNYFDSIVFYKNLGNLTFSQGQSIFNANSHIPYIYGGSWRMMDINGDDHLDLAIFISETSISSDNCIIFLNNGAGIIDPIPFYKRRIRSRNDFHQIDFDQDNDLDLIYHDQSKIYLIENVNNTSLLPPRIIFLSHHHFSKLVLFDFDHDNQLEILYHTSVNKMVKHHILKFDQNHQLQVTNQIKFYGNRAVNAPLKTEDYNQDGKLDLVSVNNNLVHQNITNNNKIIIKNLHVCDSFYTHSSGETITESNTYIDSLANDTILVNYIQFIPKDTTHIAEVICEGNQYSIGNSSFSNSGQYEVLLTNQYGCDSLIILNLQTRPQPQESSQYIETYKNEYYINGVVYTSNTEITTTFTTQYQCDSTVHYELVFLENEENDYEPITLGTFVPNPGDFQMVDFDQDGDLDMVVLSENETLLYSLEQTTANHYKEILVSDTMKIENFELKDIDNNGLLDILVNEKYAFVKLKSGYQRIIHPYKKEEKSKEIDLDEDGDLDEYEIRYTSKFSDVLYTNLYMYIKDSVGNFQELYAPFGENGLYAGYFIYPFNHQFDFGDLNNDGFMDFIVSTGSKTSKTRIDLYLSDSSFNYTQRTIYNWHSVTIYQSYVGNAKIYDINQDGNKDIVYSTNNYYNGMSKDQIVVLFNNGEKDSITFAKEYISCYDPVGFFEPMKHSGAITNINHSQYRPHQTLRIDHKNGVNLKPVAGYPGVFTIPGSTGEGSSSVTKTMDLNHDGYKDIVGNHIRQDEYFALINHHDTSYGVYRLPEHLVRLSYYEDIDADGDYDFVYNNGMSWRENISADSVGPMDTLLYIGHELPKDKYFFFYESATFAKDFDNDGHKDVLAFFENESSDLILLKNDGSNTVSYYNTIDSNVVVKQIIDFDQDGDFDIISSLAWYENTGNLDFEKHELSNQVGTISQIFDINQDGYLDILSKKDQTIAWFYNDGLQEFSMGELITSQAPKEDYTLRFMDFDFDNDFDIYAKRHIPHYSYNYGDHHILYRNKSYTPDNPKSEELPGGKEIEFLVYPNPNNGVFGVISLYDQVEMRVYSIEGKFILYQKLKSDLNQINIQGVLASGSYILTFTKPGEFSQTEHIVIVK
ncbi:MAG: T9SS type A sorting domain-containing protein [Flavobacteriales bacterium]|jgi:hypothetical protein|nr:T9SS type A sorting domain-containing protein [Flavobacteriales bacterium]